MNDAEETKHTLYTEKMSATTKADERFFKFWKANEKHHHHHSHNSQSKTLRVSLVLKLSTELYITTMYYTCIIKCKNDIKNKETTKKTSDFAWVRIPLALASLRCRDVCECYSLLHWNYVHAGTYQSAVSVINHIHKWSLWWRCTEPHLVTQPGEQQLFHLCLVKHTQMNVCVSNYIRLCVPLIVLATSVCGYHQPINVYAHFMFWALRDRM